jgi:cold shock CspA family protein
LQGQAKLVEVVLATGAAGQGFDNLKEGQAVPYEVEDDASNRRGKGPRAASVKPV